MMLVSNNNKAEENRGRIIFSRDIDNKDISNKVIPDNELWYISKNAGIRGEVILPFITNDNEHEFEIIKMETDNPNAIQDIQVVKYFYDDYGQGKYINFMVKVVKDEPFTLTLILKKGEDTVHIMSDEMIAKHKNLEVIVREESVNIIEQETLFQKNLNDILKEEIATSFQSHHVYYVYVEIGGYDFSEVQSDLNFLLNGKPVYAGTYQDNDIFASYGLYYKKDEATTWNACSAPISAISLFVKQEVNISIQVEQSYYYFSELDFLMDAKEIFFSECHNK